jgi:hypothetical protein
MTTSTDAGLPEGSITPESLAALARHFSQFDLTGDGPPVPPWGSAPSLEAYQKVVDTCAPYLPDCYQETYVAPLRRNLSRIDSLGTALGNAINPAETFLGPLYELDPSCEVRGYLLRFLILVADIYRSFLNKEKRAALNLPLREIRPPLAVFLPHCPQGPFSLPSNLDINMIGSPIGLVGLPSAYRDHPMIWGSIAHETGGHDVIHADPGLQAEIGAGVQWAFERAAASWASHYYASPWADLCRLLGRLWSYWIAEAAADVYAVLNLGPAFAMNFMPFLAALRARQGLTQLPQVLTNTINGGGLLDEHPTDILRFHLAMGVIANSWQLSYPTRLGYITLLEGAARLAAGAAQSVVIQGLLPVAGSWPIPLNFSIPLQLMQQSAVFVGQFISSCPFRALAGRSIQEIETWDDADEASARRLCAELQSNGPVQCQGDAAQLLAGATLAVAQDLGNYDHIRARLHEGLDRLRERDPLWGNRLSSS